MSTKFKTKPKMKSTIKSNGSPRTVRDLVAAARQLDDRQLVRLRKQLERIVEERWEKESETAAERLAAKGITESDIDEYIMRRRRESRR